MQQDGSVHDRLTQVAIPTPSTSSCVNIATSNQSHQENQLHHDSIDLIDHLAAPSLHIPNSRLGVDEVLNIPSLNEIKLHVHGNRDVVLSFSQMSLNPINEFTTPGYIACAFPCLFSTGIHRIF